MLNYLAESVPGAVTFDKYWPCKTLLMYGWGGDEQQKAAQIHKGKLACFDLGYWSRHGLGDRHWRVSIGGWHCPDLIMGNERPDRFGTYGLTVHNAKYSPSGPILLIGSSIKSQKIGTKNWSAKKLRELRSKTKRPIWYKVKPKKQPEPGIHADRIVRGDIFDVLPQVSMVVCRHSNVAVDAAFYGVPVVCEDGAGAAIYPNTLDGEQPSIEKRIRFLQQLAWWQWSTDEIRRGDCWKWLRKRLED